MTSIKHLFSKIAPGLEHRRYLMEKTFADLMEQILSAPTVEQLQEHLLKRMINMGADLPKHPDKA